MPAVAWSSRPLAMTSAKLGSSAEVKSKVSTRSVSSDRSPVVVLPRLCSSYLAFQACATSSWIAATFLHGQKSRPNFRQAL